MQQQQLCRQFPATSLPAEAETNRDATRWITIRSTRWIRPSTSPVRRTRGRRRRRRPTVDGRAPPPPVAAPARTRHRRPALRGAASTVGPPVRRWRRPSGRRSATAGRRRWPRPGSRRAAPAATLRRLRGAGPPPASRPSPSTLGRPGHSSVSRSKTPSESSSSTSSSGSILSDVSIRP